MKKLTHITGTSIFILFIILTGASFQKTETSKPANSLIGIWKTLGGFDSTGTIKEYYAGEEGYHTLIITNNTLILITK